MGRTFKRVALDSLTLDDIDKHRKKLEKIGITEPKLLTDNKIIKFMNEKSLRNPRIISLEEILRILQK